jgi:Protein of unknown function (DUF4054)
MAYDVPTTDDFMIRFPELGDADYAQLSLLIAEAARYVDDSWLETDYQTAILYLAAHLLLSGMSPDQSGTIQSEAFGPISVSYAQHANDDAGLMATEYGRRFVELRRNNFPRVMVV